MENVKETQQDPEVEVNAVEEEIIKPDKPEQQEEPQQQQEGQQLLQQHQELQQHEIQEHPEIIEEVAEKLIETGGKPTQQQQQEQEPMTQQPLQQETHLIDYEDDEEDDDDDEEEKETSQKLVIDIPEDEEEEEDEEDDDEVIALDELPQEEPVAKESDKISPKTEEVDAIITLSDGEEDVPVTEAASKPAKIQKRKSMGAGSVASNNEEERFRLKRRKINVAGAPKMPLTGYVRYMNDRRESLRKEHPTKTAMEHTKIIGEEWHALPADVKSTYLKAADADKQRLF